MPNLINRRMLAEYEKSFSRVEGAIVLRISSHSVAQDRDLRKALLEAALELVQQHGPEGFTLREAARRAGVASAAPYRHFPSRRALLAAVAEEGYQRLQATLLEAQSRAS